MDFFQRIKNFVTGGGFSSDTERVNNQREEEEERRRRAAEAARRRDEAATRQLQERLRTQPLQAAARDTTPTFANEAPRKPDSIQDIVSRPQKTPQDNLRETVERKKAEHANRSKGETELDRLAKANYEAARAEAQKQDDASSENAGILNKFWRWTGVDGSREAVENEARRKARAMAVRQYEEKNKGQDRDAVKKFNQETSSQLKKGSQQARDRIDNTQTAVDIMRWLPGAGAGELGANILRGNMVGDEGRNRVLREQMGLTDQEIAMMDPADVDRMHQIAQAGLWAGLLDFAAPGFGSFAKNIGRTGLKKGAQQTIKQTIDAPTVGDLGRQMMTGQGAKTIGADALIGGAAASTISGGATLAMGGDLETALQTAGSSFVPGAFGGTVQSPLNTAGNMAKAGRNVAPQSILNGFGENIDAINKTQVNPSVIEVQRATQARQAAEQVLEQTPAQVEVAPGISSQNASNTARAQAEANLQATRQAEMEAMARAQAEVEAQQAAQARQVELEAEEQARLQEAVDTEMDYGASPDDVEMARQSYIDLQMDPQARDALNSASRQADEAAEQVAQQVSDPAPVAATANKTDGRLEAEAVAEATPPPAPKSKSKLEQQLDGVDADIAAIKAQGNEVPQGLLDLRKRLRNEIIEDREFQATSGRRMVEEAPVESAPAKSEDGDVARELDEQEAYEANEMRRELLEAMDSGQTEVVPAETVPTRSADKKKTDAKTVAEPTFTPTPGTKVVKETAPAKPKEAAPAKAVTDELPRKPQLNKDGTVSKRWANAEKAKILDSDRSVNEKSAAVADIDRMVTKAIDQKNKKPPTEFAKKVKERTKKAKAEAKAEGKTTLVAPNTADALALQGSKATGESAQSFKAAMKAYREVAHIEPGRAKAREKVAAYDDDKLLKRAVAIDLNDGADAKFEAGAIMERLFARSKDKGLSKAKRDTLYDTMIETAQKLPQSSSEAGQTQRIMQDLISRLPAPFKVKKELDKLTENFKQLGKEFNPTEADRNALTSLMEKYDTDVASITKAQDDIDKLMDKLTSKTVKNSEVGKLTKQLEANRKIIRDAEKSGRAANQEYIDKLESIKPKLSTVEKLQNWAVGSPDQAANYLRMSMLSAPSGRIRDVISTMNNVIDSVAVSVIEAAGGKVANKTLGSNLVDTVGSGYSVGEGFKTAGGRIKASYTGDVPPGASVVRSRSELHASGNIDGISIFGKGRPSKPKGLLRKAIRQPRNLIRASVQVATDMSYPVYTNRLYSLGKQAAKEQGLSGKQADLYARAYMERPPENAASQAAELWLESSGMHKNVISTQLSKMADALDKAGLQNKGSKTGQFAKKAIAKWIRTSTIPFVQYTGGATHAMLVKQNPVANLGSAISAFRKGDTQTMARELSRTTWNTTKVSALTAAVYTGVLTMSDTGPDGENRYNGPFIVLPNGDHLSVGSLGIAAAAPLIGAYHASESIRKAHEGDVVGSVVESTWGSFWSTVKAAGMDNILSGENIMSGLFNSVNRTMNNPNKDSTDGFNEVIGGLLGDLGSQAIPAVLRDIDSLLNQNPDYNPLGEAPDTSGKDADGKSTPWSKAVARLQSAIPGLSKDLPRKEDSEARGFWDRVFMISPKSEAMKANEAAEADKVAALTESLKPIAGEQKYLDLLSEDSVKAIERAGVLGEPVSSGDLAKIRDELADTKVAEKFMSEGDWDGLKQSKQYKLEKLESVDGVKDDNEISKVKMDITRAEVAKEHKVEAKVYKLYMGDGVEQGGGISQSEIINMLDPDKTDVYDPELAEKLLILDKHMTDKEVSDNGDGVDPWKRNKYDIDKIEKTLAGRAKSKAGGGGRGRKASVATGFGKAKRLATVTDGGMKHRSIKRPDNPIPNLSAQAAKTNLKKTITVKKGVAL